MRRELNLDARHCSRNAWEDTTEITGIIKHFFTLVFTGKGKKNMFLGLGSFSFIRKLNHNNYDQLIMS